MFSANMLNMRSASIFVLVYCVMVSGCATKPVHEDAEANLKIIFSGTVEETQQLPGAGQHVPEEDTKVAEQSSNRAGADAVLKSIDRSEDRSAASQSKQLATPDGTHAQTDQAAAVASVAARDPNESPPPKPKLEKQEPPVLHFRLAEGDNTTVIVGEPIRIRVTGERLPAKKSTLPITLRATIGTTESAYLSRDIHVDLGDGTSSTIELDTPKEIDAEATITIAARYKLGTKEPTEREITVQVRSREYAEYLRYTDATEPAQREQLAKTFLSNYPNSPRILEVAKYLDERWWHAAHQSCDSPTLVDHTRHLSGFELPYSKDVANKKAVLDKYKHAINADSYRAAANFVKRHPDDSCTALMLKRANVKYWLARQPQSPHVSVQVGDVLVDQGDSREAEKRYLKAADQEYVPAMVRLGVLYFDARNIDEAARWINAALDASENSDSEALYWSGMLAKRRDTRFAENQFSAAISANAKCAKCFFERGQIRNVFLKRAAAQNDFKRVIQLAEESQAVPARTVRQAKNYLKES